MVVVKKGAIRSQITGIETCPIVDILYEIIDDRKHSDSNKVFIDIDLHNKVCVVGYENDTTMENINNLTKWYNCNDEQQSVNNIASKGIGQKLFICKISGKWKHVTYNEKEEVYYISEVNTYDIQNALKDNVPDSEFSEIYNKSTSIAKEEDEVVTSIHDILNNTYSIYPFNPKTIFINQKLKDTNILNEYKDKQETTYNFSDMIKRLKIKYYNEISQGLKLYIKLPGYTEFTIIENNNIDVIGFTQEKYNELNIDIFIQPDCYYGYFFKIGENMYEFRKNGNSVLRQPYKCDDTNLTPDFSILQYNVDDMGKEDKNNSIVGKSEEAYSGLYIQIGGTFISDQPVEWNVTNRNLFGSRKYRSVLKCISYKAKYHLRLNGMKSQFNLKTMNELHMFIKCITDVYKAYNKNQSSNSDDYVLIKPTASRKAVDNHQDGYFYIVELGTKFFKLGFSSTQSRIFDYMTEKEKSKNSEDFPHVDFHQTPCCRYISLSKLKKIKLFEETIKSVINESSICTTYEHKSSPADIREYFMCDLFDELFVSITDEINKHICRCDVN